VSLADLTNLELLRRWYDLEPTKGEASPERDEIADELERRGLDI
jgi:hypothetical protein